MQPLAISKNDGRNGYRSFDETTIRGLRGELRAIRNEVERDVERRKENNDFHDYDDIKPVLTDKAFDAYVHFEIDRKAIATFRQRNPELSDADVRTVAQRAHLLLKVNFDHGSRAAEPAGVKYFLPKPLKGVVASAKQGPATETTSKGADAAPRRL